MTVDELIEKLQQLPAEIRALQVDAWEDEAHRRLDGGWGEPDKAGLYFRGPDGCIVESITIWVDEDSDSPQARG